MFRQIWDICQCLPAPWLLPPVQMVPLGDTCSDLLSGLSWLRTGSAHQASCTALASIDPRGAGGRTDWAARYFTSVPELNIYFGFLSNGMIRYDTTWCINRISAHNLWKGSYSLDGLTVRWEYIFTNILFQLKSLEIKLNTREVEATNHTLWIMYKENCCCLLIRGALHVLLGPIVRLHLLLCHLNYAVSCLTIPTLICFGGT